jgi:hypothetical protein
MSHLVPLSEFNQISLETFGRAILPRVRRNPFMLKWRLLAVGFNLIVLTPTSFVTLVLEG